MKDLKTRITENMNSLTKSQRTVADYILRHLDNIPFYTLEKLSKETNVSTTTIIRFARSVGCESYSEMQELLQDELRRCPGGWIHCMSCRRMSCCLPSCKTISATLRRSPRS